jgi:multidrug efflux pump
LLTIALTLLGLVAYFVLPIAGVPQIDIPTLRVSANLPGANAETMASLAAAPKMREATANPVSTAPAQRLKQATS